MKGEGEVSLAKPRMLGAGKNRRGFQLGGRKQIECGKGVTKICCGKGEKGKDRALIRNTLHDSAKHCVDVWVERWWKY